MTTALRATDKKRPITFGFIIAFAFALLALVLVPTFMWQVQQERGKVAPLETRVHKLVASATEYENQIADEQKRVSELTRKTGDLDQELAENQKNLGAAEGRLTDQMRLTTRAQEALDTAESQLSEMRTDAGRDRNALAAIQEELGAKTPADALSVLRIRLSHLAVASQRNADYAAAAKLAGADTPAQLRERVLSMQRGAQRQPLQPSGPQLATVPSVTTYRTLPMEVPGYVYHYPGEIWLAPTTCYLIQQP